MPCFFYWTENEAVSISSASSGAFTLSCTIPVSLKNRIAIRRVNGESADAEHGLIEEGNNHTTSTTGQL